MFSFAHIEHIGGAVAAGAAAAAAAVKPVSTVIVRGHVRGGQQVYGTGAGVTVLGSVNPGGEVIADGDIHVLGALQGRALAGTVYLFVFSLSSGHIVAFAVLLTATASAGVNGNRGAVIVASQFAAQLVSIADSFAVCEETPAGVVPNRPTRVSLVDGALTFESMT